jgi:hypothetical protein
LLLDVLLDHFKWRPADSGDEVAVCPKCWQTRLQEAKLRSQQTGRFSLDVLDQAVDTELRIDLNQKVNVIRHYFELNQLTLKLDTGLLYNLLETDVGAINQDSSAVFWAPYNVVLAGVHDVVVALVLELEFGHSTNIQVADK